TQLLGVPKLKSGTGEQQANAIFDIINNWGVTNKVQVLCCDTASNTENLKKQQCRDDYKELLELTVIFLGENPPNGIFFHYPGALHHARWMSKAINSLKIYMFRKQFKLNIREENAFQDICIFLVTIYVEAWFRCPAEIDAPYNDLIFLKKLIEYADKTISNTATHTFCGHVWYLALESIAMSFFDFRVPTEIKIKMVEALKSTQNNDDTIKKIVLSKEDIKTFIKNNYMNSYHQRQSTFFQDLKFRPIS
ncbi:Uncharacterized protein FWK35_00032037, partial [Aphis craccivora]